MLTRRKFLKASSLAAPFIILPKLANSQFWQGQLHYSGIINGQVKPTGTPTYVGNSTFPGMLFYAFDTGTGVYSIPVNTTTPLAFDPTTTILGGSPNIWPGTGTPYDPDQSRASVGSTAYGTAMLWTPSMESPLRPGGGAFVGGGAFPSGDPLRTAVNMNANANGAVFTMFATFMQTGDVGAEGGFVTGRGADLDCSQFVCAFFIAAGGSPGTDQLSFQWIETNINPMSGDQNPQSITSSVSPARNVIHTVVVQCVNTTGGPGAMTTITLYLDGTQVGQKTNQTMTDISPSSNANLEDQWQFGTLFHVYSGQDQASFNGPVYQAGVATSAWTMPSAALSLYNNPYQMLTI